MIVGIGSSVKDWPSQPSGIESFSGAWMTFSDTRTHRLLEDIKFILEVLVEELTTVRIMEKTTHHDLHTTTTVIGKEFQDDQDR